jgi:peptidyl-prolyl cis-trans isomerase B (cyclophilin B)
MVDSGTPLAYGAVSRVGLIALSLALLAVVGCGDDGDDSSASKPAATAKPKLVCKDVSAPRKRAAGGEQKPTEQLKPDATYTVTLTTSCGDFTIKLDQKAAPRTAASFASLVRNGFYDDTVFHRIVPGFVIQGGDPTATGTGGPGYRVRDRPPADTVYTQGVAAMAKAGTDPPGTSGSQFFVVTGADAGLPPEYAPLGKVVRGLRVVELIGAQGDPASGGTGTPKRVVALQKATLSEE